MLLEGKGRQSSPAGRWESDGGSRSRWPRVGADVASLDIDAANNAETAAQVRATGRQGIAIDCDVAGQDRRYAAP